MKNFLDIDVALGGYYASKGESGKRYSAFRLLDFTSDAYHAALFSERFDQMPTMQELGRLAPYIGHAPIDVRSLLKEREIRLVGTLPLTRDDLEGYRIYLEHHDVAESEISELMTNLMASSTEPPIRLRLEAVNDEISISERE